MPRRLTPQRLEKIRATWQWMPFPMLYEHIAALEAELADRDELIGRSIPALGCHARDFSQDTLIDACEIQKTDPYDWTHHPDVLRRLLEHRYACQQGWDRRGLPDAHPPETG